MAQTETTNQEYIVILASGQTTKESNLDLKAIHVEMNKHTTFAVKVGKKAYSKQSLKMIVKAESAEKNDHNFALLLGGLATYSTVTDAEKAVEQITESVNTQLWVLFNESILFNRNAFECAESF